MNLDLYFAGHESSTLLSGVCKEFVAPEQTVSGKLYCVVLKRLAEKMQTFKKRVRKAIMEFN
jgi:hypothetical protein